MRLPASLSALPALLLVLLLAACTEHTAPEEYVYDRFGPDGKAYVNIGLTMTDGAAATRAVTYDDGDASANEYAVNEAVIIIFGSKAAAPAPGNMYFRAVSKITAAELTSSSVPSTDRVTQTHSKVIELSKGTISETERLFAFALVNGDNYSITGNTITFNSTETFQNSSTADSKNSFQHLMDLQCSSFGGTTAGFVMTNAPLANQSKSTYNSSTIAVTYLPEILPGTIYPTEQKAKDNPGTDIYVERMAAKVTVVGSTESGTKFDGKLTADPAVKYDKDKITWSTDQTNTVSFAVRHVSTSYLGYEAGSKGLRFLDDTPTGTGLYRIHWGEDVNYHYLKAAVGTDGAGNYKNESASTTSDLPYIKNSGKADFTTTGAYADIGKSLYCHENTMSVLGLTQGRTTRVVIAVPFIVGQDGSSADVTEDFYTISTDGPDKIWLKSGTAVASSTGKTITDKIISIVGSLKEYQAWKAANATVKDMADGDILDVKIVNGSSSTTGYVDIGQARAEVLVKSSLGGGSVLTEFKSTFHQAGETFGSVSKNINDIDKQLAADLVINHYAGGKAYYKVLVRHFGDDEVADYTDTEGGDFDKVYPETDRDKNFLGRYGVLRNTWYTITLQGVKHIGFTTPEIPVPYDTPDDEVDNYLSVKIHITKWAKRGQKTTL